MLAALEHRRRTGQGQYIDLSQAEASLQLLAPAVLDYTANGRVLGRAGNDDPVFAPHGVYPAEGDDQWVAIAVTDDAQWRALCAEVGLTDLAGLSAGERRRGGVSSTSCWRRGRSGQPADGSWNGSRHLGIPAHQVQNTVEAFDDPQLAHRGHFASVPHTVMGQTWVEGCRLRFSRTPAAVHHGAPTIGEHSWHVLTDLLGYDPEQAAELAVAGAFE